MKNNILVHNVQGGVGHVLMVIRATRVKQSTGEVTAKIVVLLTVMQAHVTILLAIVQEDVKTATMVTLVLINVYPYVKLVRTELGASHVKREDMEHRAISGVVTLVLETLASGKMVHAFMAVRLAITAIHAWMLYFANRYWYPLVSYKPSPNDPEANDSLIHKPDPASINNRI